MDKILEKIKRPSDLKKELLAYMSDAMIVFESEDVEDLLFDALNKLDKEFRRLKKIELLATKVIEPAYHCRHCGAPVSHFPGEDGNHPCKNPSCNAVKLRKIIKDN